MSYLCPACGDPIANWAVSKGHFECPNCKVLLTSNSNKVFKQSLAVALVVWFLVLIGIQQYTGSWGYAVAVSIEVGGILAAMLATLYYRIAMRLIRVT